MLPWLFGQIFHKQRALQEGADPNAYFDRHRIFSLIEVDYFPVGSWGWQRMVETDALQT